MRGCQSGERIEQDYAEVRYTKRIRYFVQMCADKWSRNIFWGQGRDYDGAWGSERTDTNEYRYSHIKIPFSYNWPSGVIRIDLPV